MISDGRNTFWLSTPRDLLEKLKFELKSYWNTPAFNIVDRSYVILNGAITGWQMKDWVWAALKDRRSLEILHDLAGRQLKDSREFGDYLCASNEWMAMCYHIATSAKHYRVTSNRNPTIHTIIEPDREKDDLWVTYAESQMPAADLLFLVGAYWEGSLRHLNLYEYD